MINDFAWTVLITNFLIKLTNHLGLISQNRPEDKVIKRSEVKIKHLFL
jgi:hypothetical protein